MRASLSSAWAGTRSGSISSTFRSVRTASDSSPSARCARPLNTPARTDSGKRVSARSSASSASSYRPASSSTSPAPHGPSADSGRIGSRAAAHRSRGILFAEHPQHLTFGPPAPGVLGGELERRVEHNQRLVIADATSHSEVLPQLGEGRGYRLIDADGVLEQCHRLIVPLHPPQHPPLLPQGPRVIRHECPGLIGRGGGSRQRLLRFVRRPRVLSPCPEEHPDVESELRSGESRRGIILRRAPFELLDDGPGSLGDDERLVVGAGVGRPFRACSRVSETPAHAIDHSCDASTWPGGPTDTCVAADCAGLGCAAEAEPVGAPPGGPGDGYLLPRYS